MFSLLKKCRVSRLCFLGIIVLIGSTDVAGQSKLKEARQSTVTGVPLPPGSKRDTRTLSVGAANMIMETAGEQAGVTLQNAEVLSLQPVRINQFTADSLKARLQETGWNVIPAEAGTRYWWLEQSGKYVLVLFDPGKKETALYFAQANQAPAGWKVVNRNESPAPARQFPEKPAEKELNVASNSSTSQSITSFDDGWVAKIKPDWVEVSKGEIRVLLHFAKEGTISSADPEPFTNTAWNILVAPRYSSLRNYKVVSPSLDPQRAYMGSGIATEKSSGKEKYVALFLKNQLTGWIEFIAPDKSSFIQAFGVDADQVDWGTSSEVWGKMLAMSGYNRFAVKPSELSGKWNKGAGGNTFYFNAYTGQSAGMSTYSSTEWFMFSSENRFDWQLVASNSAGGVTHFASGKGSGTFKMLSEWRIWFSRLDNEQPRTFDIYFSAVKGGMILNLKSSDQPCCFDSFLKTE